MSVRVNALDHLVINVSDVTRSTEWYRKILGMEVKVFDPGPGKMPRTSLVFGNQKINVRPRGADKVEWFTADHAVAGSEDLYLLTSNPPEQVVAHLRAGWRSRRVRLKNGAPRRAALDLLPRSRRQSDRDIVVSGWD